MSEAALEETLDELFRPAPPVDETAVRASAAELKSYKPYNLFPKLEEREAYNPYASHRHPYYQKVEVSVYNYQVPWFATAMTDGEKIWFGPRGEFYDPHPDDRLNHELSHWRISTPYGTELDVEAMAQLQLPRIRSVSVSYRA